MTYRARHLIAAGLLGLLLGALAVHAAHAASRPQSTAPVFRDVQVPAAASKQPAASDDTHQATPAYKPADPVPGDSGSDRADAASTPGLILDPATPTQSVERPAVAPTAELHVVSKAPRTANSVSGTASWGDDWSGVVTRLPRGTAICVAGPLGRWCGASVGYGPALWTGRIADLSRAVFGDICGPVSAGLCRVVLSW